MKRLVLLAAVIGVAACGRVIGSGSGSDGAAPTPSEIDAHDVHADELDADTLEAHDVHVQELDVGQVLPPVDDGPHAADNVDCDFVAAGTIHAHDVHVRRLHVGTLHAHAVMFDPAGPGDGD